MRRVAVIFDTEARPDTTGVYCRRALAKLAEVEHFLPTELSRIPRQGFDLYLNVDDGLRYRLPADLRPCAWWAIDTHLDFDWYLAKAPDFDYVFAAQRDGAERLRQAGAATAAWLPLACDPEIHAQHEVPKAYDVCFVGHLFDGPRAELVKLLQDNFPSAFVGQAFFEDMARDYSAARLVFNRSLRSDVNMRVFEALACGSLLVTDDLRDNGQEELFHDGVHLATYREAGELLDKVRYYLKHEDVRERLAAAGRAEALAKHTYEHRMRRVLAAVEGGRTTSAPVPGGVPGDGRPEPGLFPDWPSLIPPGARKILLLGGGYGQLAEALRQRQAAEVIALDDPERADATFAPAAFDAVVCGNLLEQVRDPLALLKRWRPWLRPDGSLLAAASNLRHHRALSSLLAGHWGGGVASVYAPGILHFYTRRELEKLFTRAGFTAAETFAQPGAEHADWQRRGRPGEVRVGSLHVGQLPPAEAEEFYVAAYLVRATPQPRPDPGLTSIIIATHNELAYTRLCLDSVRQYTDEPYELIVVDNGSADGTVEYLRSCPDVMLLINAENRGFPAAVNQGLRVAGGRQILLLNNDTVVTTGWLTRMLQALATDPAVGLVGPCSNRVSGEQQVAVNYDDLAGLDAFAWEWGQANRGQLRATDRLVGFCLLIRRAVVEKVGMLDERFGVGCFEDDDYCLRASRAGFRAVIARDAFVHHFAGRTFVGSGVDFAALIATNERLFREKWADPAATVPPATGPADPPVPAVRYAVRKAPGGGLLLEQIAIRLSLCMIVRDSARTLEACLNSIRPWVDEMVVVDTGSKDDTPALAARLGARVFHFPWCDSFSAARNESLRHARGAWVFWMDADDTIDTDNGRKLRELASRDGDPKVLGYVMQVHCPAAGEDGRHDMIVVDHVKLLRNRPELRFEGRIHEQILPAIRRLGGETAWTDLFVVHSGYDHSPAGQEHKKRRDLHLLHLELAEQPDHPFTLFNLGMTYADVGEYERAAGFLERSIRVSGEADSHLRKAYALLVHCYAQLGHIELAGTQCERGLRLFPEDAELRFRQGLVLHQQGQLAAAVRAYEGVLKPNGPRHFTSIDRGIQGFKARQNLAVAYTDLGDLGRAEAEWRQVVADVPGYRLGWRGLGDSLLRQGKVPEARALAKRLLAERPLRAEGLLLQGQAALAEGRLPAAQAALHEATAGSPEDPGPLQAWCRFLFEHGDVGEAAAALRELVRQEPADPAAYHNLGVVYLRQGRPAEAIEAFRTSVRLRPRSAATWVQFGNALHDGGREGEAAAVWREALALESGNAEAAEALRRAEGRPPVGTGGPAGTNPMRLRSGTLQVPIVTRGPVDQAIVRDLWERDVYGIRDLDEQPATVLDIGAHIGAFTLLACHAWPGARVIACEADVENFDLLRRNLAARQGVETVQTAILGEEVREADFFAVPDKATANSGGGSCTRAEPGSMKMRVPALSVKRLWDTARLTTCDLLKLDCEGAEVPILRGLATAGLLGRVRHIVGEWHAPDAGPASRQHVQDELRAVLEETHMIEFCGQRPGREGHFTARPRRA
jgi:FkbM family methyltransferase